MTGKADQLLAAAAQADAKQQTKLRQVLTDARRLRERGPQSMYPEDEARHMADSVLGLLVETLEALTSEVRP
jgi:hypothetical protein